MRFRLAIPSAPQNVQVIFVNQSALEIQWQLPVVTGDQTNVFYEVECHRLCESEDKSKCVDKPCGSDVIFKPRKDGLSITHVIVGNLTSYVNYTMKIYAKNRVSNVAKWKHRIEASLSEITVRTNGSGKSWSAPELNRISHKFPSTYLLFRWRDLGLHHSSFHD